MPVTWTRTVDLLGAFYRADSPFAMGLLFIHEIPSSCCIPPEGITKHCRAYTLSLVSGREKNTHLLGVRMPGFLIGNEREELLGDGGGRGELHSSTSLTKKSLFSPFFPGLMEIRSVSVGVVAIKSVSTGLYLAMSKKGSLFGSVGIFSDIIKKKEC